MQVKFWGTRGSIPVATSAQATYQRLRLILQKAIQQKVHDSTQVDDFLKTLSFDELGSFGGNTSCVQIDDGGDFMLCDFGTGARQFGHYALTQRRKKPTFHIFISHLHWDHIMGFPFFTPAYRRSCHLKIYGCHQQLEDTFRKQHRDPNFPVDFSQLGANIEFIQLEPDKDYLINGFKVRAKLQIHKGDSYGYRFEKDGKSVVYSTDSEHAIDDQQYLNRVVNFFMGADLVIFDAMYSLLESITYKKDWGHSNNLTGVELCQRAQVKHLCLFHHEPTYSDSEIMISLLEARDYENLTRGKNDRLVVDAAYDGKVVTIE